MNLQIPEGDFEGYVFDCDGTLADTMPLHYEAWLATLKPHGVDLFPEPYFYELGGVPSVEIVRLLNERNGLSLDPDQIVEQKEATYISLLGKATPIQPVVDFAKTLRDAGKPIAVASGGHHAIIRGTLTALGIFDWFDAIVGVEDYVNGKPAPDPFLAAACKLGVDPKRCLAFEDSDVGIQSASSAGMATVQVPDPRA
ncbi:MAG: HAD family hydrolase [Chthoniobacteraceae bacterium]